MGRNNNNGYTERLNECDKYKTLPKRKRKHYEGRNDTINRRHIYPLTTNFTTTKLYSLENTK